jgi:hypothetical protein
MLNPNKRKRGHGVLIFQNDDMTIIPDSSDIPNNFSISVDIDRKQRVIWMHTITDNALNGYPIKTYPITDEMMFMTEPEMLLYINYSRDGLMRHGMGDPEWLKSWIGVTGSYTCKCCKGIHKLNRSFEICPECGSMYEYRSAYLPDDWSCRCRLVSDEDIV